MDILNYFETSLKIIDLYNDKEYRACADQILNISSEGVDRATADAICGICLIHLSNFQEATDCIESSIKEDPYNAFALLGGAYLDLMRGKKIPAVHKYARLVIMGKFSWRAKNILEKIKKVDAISQLLSSKKITFFLPAKISKDFRDQSEISFRKFKKIMLIVLGFFLLISLFYFLFCIRSYFSQKKIAFEQRTASATTGSWRYSVTEITTFLQEMRFCLASGKINQAIMIYNKIQQSEVNQELKNPFIELFDNISIPSLNQFENTHSVGEALQDPFTLSTYIKIEGKLLEKKISSGGGITIILGKLHKEPTIKQIPIIFEQMPSVFVKKENFYQVLVQYKGFDTNTGDILLWGLSIRQI